MIRGLGVVLTIAGMAGLILGVLGIFGQNYFTLNPWVFAILGLIVLLTLQDNEQQKLSWYPSLAAPHCACHAQESARTKI